MYLLDLFPGARFTKDILSFILKLLQLSYKLYFFNVFFSKIHCNFVLQETRDINCCMFASCIGSQDKAMCLCVQVYHSGLALGCLALGAV